MEDESERTPQYHNSENDIQLRFFPDMNTGESVPSKGPQGYDAEYDIQLRFFPDMNTGESPHTKELNRNKLSPTYKRKAGPAGNLGLTKAMDLRSQHRRHVVGDFVDEQTEITSAMTSCCNVVGLSSNDKTGEQRCKRPSATIEMLSNDQGDQQRDQSIFNDTFHQDIVFVPPDYVHYRNKMGDRQYLKRVEQTYRSALPRISSCPSGYSIERKQLFDIEMKINSITTIGHSSYPNFGNSRSNGKYEAFSSLLHPDHESL